MANLTNRDKQLENDTMNTNEQTDEKAKGLTPEKIEPTKRVKPKSRSARWSEAASAAAAAISDLKDIQQEFQDWMDNLPENLQSSNLADKLNTVCDLDLEGAQSTIEEAEGADLPLGFGRD